MNINILTIPAYAMVRQARPRHVAPPTQAFVRQAITHCILLMVFALAAATGWADVLTPGKGSFEFRDEKGNPDKPITVWYYRPAVLKPDTKIVIVMHGVDRNGEDYRDHWARYAEKYNFLLLTPEFAEQYYPKDEYQFGNVRQSNTEKWTFSAIEHLFDHIKASEALTAPSYYIYGHSAGAQFVHRYMLFMPNPRVALAISANAGSYTLPIYPTWTQPAFPWSLDKTIVNEERLKSVFARNLLVLLGEDDIDPNHKHLPRSREAKAQGANRMERGKNFFNIAKDSAARLGTAFNWSLQTVPGVAHSDTGMSKAAVQYIVANDR